METKTFFTFLPSEACGTEKTGNRETMKIEAITKENLPRCRELILPYIYEELENYEGDPAAEYICLQYNETGENGTAAPVSALIMLLEPEGELALLSVYTLPEYRRQGYASELLAKAVFVARKLFQFDEGANEEFIDLKAVYRLTDEYRTAFEAFLKINGFTDFYLIDEEDAPQVWAAVAELRFYKTQLPGNNY